MTPASSRALAERMAWAVDGMNARRYAEVRAGLAALAQAHRDQPDLQHLFGVACLKCGDPAGAETALRAALSADRRRPAFHVDLARLLRATGREKEAERSLRAALALDRRHDPAATELAELLNARGRAAETLQVTTPLLALSAPSEALLTAHADALRLLGRHADRLEVVERTRAAFPQSAVAEHNLAASLGDLGRAAAAEAAALGALAKGLDAPETWLVLGRARQVQGRLDEAEVALRAALQRRPAMADAHRALAQLVWMRTGATAPAAAALDAALAFAPGDLALHLVRLQLMKDAEDEAGLDRALHAAVAACGPSAVLETTAARARVGRDPEAARRHAEQALALAPGDEAAATALCEAHLALGEAQAAVALVETLRRAHPEDQHLIAYQATAWRLLDDARYRTLYDYEAFVRPAPIDTPAGWSSLGAYLQDLREALLALHHFDAHPFAQSLRGGSQTAQRLEAADAAPIRAFLQAVDEPVRAYAAALGPGKDPLRARNRGGHALAGVWSVRLKPGAGRHVDHVHQQGWLSSAFYVDLPPAVEADGRQGWIKFGEPGVPTRPALGPEHWVKPEPGMLVLFPSYMWHGTTPFGGDRPRLTMAFDMIPAKPRR